MSGNKTFSNMSVPDLRLTMECYQHEIQRISDVNVAKVFPDRYARLVELIDAIRDELINKTHEDVQG